MLARGVVALLVVVGTAAPARADQAADLIAKGEKLFAEKKYAEATNAFRLAVHADKKSGLARYHWARGMAALRSAPKGPDPCGPQGIGKDHILTQLRQAVALDPALRDRASAEPLFTVVHQKFAWHVHVLGRALDQPADVDAILRGVEWHGKSNGVCDHTTMRFKDGGVVELWVREVKSQDDLTCTTRRADVGTYTVKDQTVTVKLKGERKPQSGKLTRSGKLLLAAEPGPYSDDELECAT